MAIIDRLRESGLPFEEKIKESVNADDFFAGKTFVLTGELSTMTRSEASEKIIERGGKVTSSVSKKTDYVISGSSPGLKYDKAVSLDIAIMDEDELLNRLK